MNKFRKSRALIAADFSSKFFVLNSGESYPLILTENFVGVPWNNITIFNWSIYNFIMFRIRSGVRIKKKRRL